MITEKQKKWLIRNSETPDETKEHYSLYMQRIQKQITKNLDHALWLAKKYPEILLDEEGFGDKKRHDRLQKLLLLIKILKPQYDVYLAFAKEIKETLED